MHDLVMNLEPFKTSVLKVYRTHPDVQIPKMATAQSACFDLCFDPSGKTTYKGYSQNNKPFERQFSNDCVTIMPGERILVPTGLIFDIPAGYSIRVHPRSGLSVKQGLILANCEGVIDSDYVEESYITLYNVSTQGQVVAKGDRLAQAELIRLESYVIEATSERPVQKTERMGGFGSTGISDADTINAATPPVVPQVPVKRGRGRPRKNPLPAA